MKIIVFFILISILFFGCGKGIAPTNADENQKPGFSGTITFLGNWPEDVTRTHLVVFENRLETAADFNISNLKYISYEIPFGVKTYNYNSQDSAYINIGTGKYEYIAVAQQTTENLSLFRKDWHVVGIYYANGDISKTGEMVIPENGSVQNINIICDFNNPPPQPPGGI